MVLKKLSIKGFGKLKNTDIDLLPNFNIIYGKNESGKSTLQAFVKAIFYGLDKTKKKTSLSEIEKYRPWNTDEFAGMIEYESEGFTYKAGRNFITNKVSLCNEFWDDISDKFKQDKKKGPLFAQEHFGLSEECFERTIFIRQLESKFKDYNNELIDKLVNIQQTGQEDISFRDSVQILEDTIKNKIGNNKTRKKPLNEIDNQISHLLEEKKEIINLREEILEIEEKIKQKQEERQKIIEKIKYNKDIKQLLKKEDLIQIYNKAKKYEDTIESIDNEMGSLKLFDNFPVHLEDRLRELLIELKNCNNTLIEKQDYLTQIKSELELKEQNEQNKDIDIQNIYVATSEFEIMKQAIEEKKENEKKLNTLIKELDVLDFQAEAENEQHSTTNVVNYEEQKKELDVKINKLNEIQDKINNIENKSKNIKINTLTKTSNNQIVSLHDIDKILNKYDELVYKNKELTLEQSQIKKVQDNKHSKEHNQYKFNIIEKIKNLKINLAVNVILMIISIGLLGYGFIGITSELNPIFYLLIFLGIVIGGFTSINVVKNIKSRNTLYKNQKDLNTELENKQNYLNNEIKELQSEISFMLELFNIKHKPSKINTNHIRKLDKKFIKLLKDTKQPEKNINKLKKIRNKKQELLYSVENITGKKIISLKDIEYILNDLINQREELKLELNETHEPHNNENNYIQLKKYEIEQIKSTIEKLDKKIDNSTQKIKSILELYSIDCEEEFISKEKIDELKHKHDKLSEQSSELISLNTIKENAESEVLRLKQYKENLKKEKEEILEKALVENEDEFFEGCNKYNKLNELTEERSKISNLYSDLLKGENSKDILSKIQEMENINTKYNTDNKSEENLESEIESLNEELKKLDQEIINLKNESDNKLKGKKDLNQIIEQIGVLQEQRHELEQKKSALEVAIDVIKESSQQIQKDFSPKFQQEISSVISQITENRYSQIKTNERLDINVVTPDTGQIVGMENLSVGTIEQFYLSLRIALSNLLSTKEEKLPLIIDEAFVHYDDDRAKNVLNFLINESKDRQIIFFTCQKRDMNIIKNLSKSKKLNIIEL